MNQPLRYFLISASIAAAASAAPFMAIGDGAELFATGVLGVRADDNILLSNASKESDVIFDVTPGLELSFGKNAQFQGTLTAADNIIYYADHDELNTNLASVNLVTKYDDGKTKLGGTIGYNELNQNTVDIRPTVDGRLIRRNIITVAVNGEVNMTELTSVGGGITFNDERYKAPGYVDSEVATVPLNIYYKWTPKVDLSLGYQYRDYSAQTSGEISSIDHFYNIGARGEFTPKLTGKIAVGYTERRIGSYDSRGQIGVGHVEGSNRGQFGLDTSLAYEFSPKTTLQFGANNQFGTSPTGLQQRNLTANTLVTTRLNEEWALNGGVSYRRIAYNGNSDDYWEGLLGATYIINANVKLNGGYTYRTYKSDLAGADFSNNVFSLAANFRY